MNILPIETKHISQVSEFSNRNIGVNYYSKTFFSTITSGPFQGASVMLIDENSKIRGVRLTLGPGEWLDDFEERKLYVRAQGLDIHNMAYFKTIFVDPELTGKGWGVKLSQFSIEFLKSKGCAGIVTHSVSNFSAHNSSFRYLTKLGFFPLGEHPKYWVHFEGLHCHICQSCPCQCDALEMYLSLS